MKSKMIEAMSWNVVVLSQNAYGNYALQVALDVNYYKDKNHYSIGIMKTVRRSTKGSFHNYYSFLFKSLHLML
jgi:hypothetical protein